MTSTPEHLNRLTHLISLGDPDAYDAYRRELERRGMWWCGGYAHKVWTLDEATEWFLRAHPGTKHGWAVHDKDHRVVAVVFVWRLTNNAAAHLCISEDGCVDVTPWMDGHGISRTTSPIAPARCWPSSASGCCAFLQGDSHLLSARWGRPLGWNVLTPCESSAPPRPRTP